MPSRPDDGALLPITEKANFGTSQSISIQIQRDHQSLGRVQEEWHVYLASLLDLGKKAPGNGQDAKYFILAINLKSAYDAAA